jgi:copper(I)-binding protein
MMRASILAGLGALVLATPVLARPHPAPSSGVIVSNAVVRASLGGSTNTAAYMTLTNPGSRPDRLLSVSCACAGQAEVHASRMTGGMMTMASAGPVAVPAHGRVTFAPGGLHVMLTGMKTRLVDGRRQDMVLRFERAGAVRASFQVRARIVSDGGMGPMSGPMRGMNH